MVKNITLSLFQFSLVRKFIFSKKGGRNKDYEKTFAKREFHDFDWKRDRTMLIYVILLQGFWPIFITKTTRWYSYMCTNILKMYIKDQTEALMVCNHLRIPSHHRSASLPSLYHQHHHDHLTIVCFSRSEKCHWLREWDFWAHCCLEYLWVLIMIPDRH